MTDERRRRRGRAPGADPRRQVEDLAERLRAGELSPLATWVASELGHPLARGVGVPPPATEDLSREIRRLVLLVEESRRPRPLEERRLDLLREVRAALEEGGPHDLTWLGVLLLPAGVVVAWAEGELMLWLGERHAETDEAALAEQDARQDEARLARSLLEGGDLEGARRAAWGAARALAWDGEVLDVDQRARLGGLLLRPARPGAAL